MNMIASSGQLRASYIRWALLFVPAIILLGIVSAQIGGSATDDPWFAALRKPPAYPPSWVFGVVWPVLYAMMGFALAMVVTARGAPGRVFASLVFAAQLAVNLAWSPVFFGEHFITVALVLLGVLDAAVLLTMVLFWRIRSFAGLLLLPYLAWILFATYLTWEIRIANPDMDGRRVSGPVQRVEF